MPARRLRPSGGYRHLLSFQAATVIYDGTVSFCARFLDKRSRTVDQMVQAARSGRQNIAEGSCAAATSSQTELRLVNVARASLDELLLDYEDYLRQKRLPMWAKDDPQARQVRELRISGSTGQQHIAAWLDSQNPAVVANTLICLIHQASYLLDRQIQALERSFIGEGGYSEQLAAARIKQRGRQPKDQSPSCPRCGAVMVLRSFRRGKNEIAWFWGCTRYPECRGTRRSDESDVSDDSVRSV
jgi:four helix bundle suffix protein